MGILDSWEFSGEPGHVHIGVCASPLCGVPGWYEYIRSLCWSGWRAGTDFLLLGSVLACVCVIEQVGGVAGQYDFLVFSVSFWRVGTIEMVGGAVFKFSLSSVCC